MKKGGPDEEPEDQIITRSASWKSRREVGDFLWLVARAIPAGSSKSHVEALLGVPLDRTPLLNGGVEWRYVRSNSQKQQVDSLSIAFDANGAMVLFLAVPDKTVPQMDLAEAAVRMPPQTPDEVRQAFQAQARPIVDQFAMTSGRPDLKLLKSLISTSNGQIVQRQPCSHTLEEVNDLMTESERAILVLHGAVDDLRREGECWSITSDGACSCGLAGYLDVGTGKLLLLRITPEG
ncbi:MAG TPA: hypothetical protein VMY37_18100 [Thermoguttaceae bacterium]|nr:hypothetical protein [Thermoguttaceae bacterium]